MLDFCLQQTDNLIVNLKRFIDDNGIKMGWLAEKLGITYQTVSAWCKQEQLTEKQERRILSVLRIDNGERIIDYNQSNKSAQSKQETA